MTGEPASVQALADPPPKAGEDSAISRYKKALRAARKKRGIARESDEGESEQELEEGVTLLHKLFARWVTLHPENIVRKTGKRINLGEAEALRVAEKAGLPVTHVYKVETTPDGNNHIHMDYIPGTTLEKLWPGMSTDQKEDICQQLRGILEAMRSVTPPPSMIGACDGKEIRDTRLYFKHKSPVCPDEATFSNFLLADILKNGPPAIQTAFTKRMRIDHRIVFTHCDLAPRNIIVQDGKITGLIDWEDGGWYPEYWGYVKVFQRSGMGEGDWLCYTDKIFPQKYHDELVDYFALARWQAP